MHKALLLLTLIALNTNALFSQMPGKPSGGLGASAPSIQTKRIGTIEVQGSEKVDKQALILISGLATGQDITIPSQAISNAIKQLWKQQLFSDIQILKTNETDQNIDLIIQVKERSRLSRFTFDGIRKSEVDDLREDIDLYKEKIITEDLIVETKNQIRAYYKDKGFHNAQVNIKQYPDSLFKNHDILAIDIQKNAKVKIDQINIENNSVLSDKKIRKLLKETKRRSIFDPLYGFGAFAKSSLKSFFNQDSMAFSDRLAQYLDQRVNISIFKQSKYLGSNFKSDKQALIAKYNEMGYRDAQVEWDTLTNTSSDGITIHMRVDEGNRYYFRNITWSGNTKYSTKILNKVLGIEKGDVYNQSVLEQRLFMSQNSTDVSSLYMDNGYLFFQLTPIELMAEGDSIDLELRIYEGRQARIKRVSVVGNTKTSDHVVIREIRTKPGQLFNRSDIIRTQRELSQLGFFDPEKLNVIPTPNPVDGTVDIEYVVEEKPSDQLQLSAGWGGSLYGTLGLAFNNFSTRNVGKKGAWQPLPSGDGQRLNIQAQSNGSTYQGYNLSFTEPWLGGKKPNALTASVWYNQQTNNASKYLSDTTDAQGDKIENPNRVYLKIYSLSLALGTRLKWPDDYFTLSHEVTYQNYNLKGWEQFIFSTGRSNNLFYKLNLSRNSIDQPIYPRKGAQVNTSLQFTLPYSYLNSQFSTTPNDYKTLPDAQKYKWAEYYKIKVSADWYTELADKLVLKTKVGFGFLGNYNNDIGTAPFERFYLGGSGLTNFQVDAREIIALRGYDDQSVFSYNPTLKSPLRNSGQPIIAKYTMELRYPLSLNPQATIFALGFLEAGNTWYDKFNPFFMKRSGGFGIRAFLPMFGLLGLDWGYRFDSVEINPTMPKSQIHFTIGVNLGEL
jgi:outer membrane protein insertion porin family